jgi:hypothetical protein
MSKDGDGERRARRRRLQDGTFGPGSDRKRTTHHRLRRRERIAQKHSGIVERDRDHEERPRCP